MIVIILRLLKFLKRWGKTMSYAGGKEQKLSMLLRDVVIRAQGVAFDEGYYDSFTDKKYAQDLVYARVTGRFVDILSHINFQLVNGRSIEEIQL